MIASDGLPYVAATLVAAAALVAIGAWAGGGVVLLATIFFVNFFRDPERGPASDDPADVVSPADGRIVVAGELAPEARPELARDLPLCVSIFMNVFDVHVNRAPLAGTIAAQRHEGGLKLPADASRARLENERNLVRLDTAHGPLVFVQVAGLVARRIVFRKAVGGAVARGERVGIIKFGSRVDVYLPAGSQLLLREGDRCRAGETILARMPS